MSARPEALKEATAKEALGEVPSYNEAGLSRKFAEQVAARQAIDSQIKELEADKDGLSREIFERLASTGLKAVQVESFRPTIIDADRRSISAEKLLELGVPATVIERATVVSHSTFLRVFDTTKADTRSKEKRGGVESIRGKKR